MAELYIYSQNDELLTIITEGTGLVSAPVRIELNSVPDTPFSFIVEADSENAQYVKDENKVVYRDHEGDLRLFVIRELDDSDTMDGPLTTAICEPEFMELAETFVLDRRFTDQTAQFALDAALENTGWIGEVEVDLGLASTNFYRMRVVDAVLDIIKTWGGEFKDVVEFDESNDIVARKIKILQRLGQDTGQRFEIDHNITEIGRTVLSYPVTAMYGWGASLETEGGGHTRYIDFGDVEWKKANGDPVDKPKGQLWVGDPDAFEKYKRYRGGRWIHRFGEFSNQDYEDPEELLWATWQNLQENKRPEVNYRLSVYLFNDEVSLGDTVIAIDRYFARPIEIQARIIAMEYDLMDIEGTAVVEMGQFLNLDDNRIDELEEKIDKVASRPQRVTENSYPDTKPGTPINVQAKGSFETIQLNWDYDSAIYVKHYEVYGSQVADFVPDTQHLLWRGDISAFNHSVNTDETWYYYVRAVNYRGTPSDWSVCVSGSTVRIISDDILFGEDLAERLRELNRISDIIGENGVDFNQLTEEARNLLNQQANEYTDQQLAFKANQSQVDTIESELNGAILDIADKADLSYVDGQLVLKANQSQVDGLVQDIAGKADLTYVNGQLTSKADKADTYTITQVDNALNSKVSTTQYTTDINGIVTDLNDHESRITQTETDITSKVSSTQYNQDILAIQGDISTLETTVGNHTTSINQNASAISLKANATDVYTKTQVDTSLNNKADASALNTIETRVSETEAELTVQAGQIASKVSQTEYDADINGVVTRLNSAESSITQNANEISQRVTTTTYNAGMASKEGTVYKQNSAPAHSNGRLWLNTSVTPNVLYRSTGSSWVKSTPTTANEVGAYSSSAGSSLANRVTTAESNITQNANAITLKASQSALDSLEGDVTQISSDVSSLQVGVNGITADVSSLQTITNGHTTDISSLNSQLTVQAGRISSKVDATYVTGAIADIEVGGRNLFVSSNLDRFAERFTKNTTKHLKARMNYYFNFIVELEPNTEYVVSNKMIIHDGSGSEAENTIRLTIFDENTVTQKQTIGTLYSGGSISFKTNSNITQGDKLLMYPTGNTAIDFEVLELKLEKGNKATDWTPAPEDTQAEIDSVFNYAESEITQLANEIDLKINADGVVSQINLNREGIRIKGNLIHLDGLALIDNSIIQTAHIANGSITNLKIGTGAVDTLQVKDGAITNAKISDLSADKINAGSIRGIDIYGAQFRSSDGNTRLDITGGNIRLRQSNNDYMQMNPNGLFGYNANGSQRFKVDQTLVTSSALGTSVENVYLAAFGEARVVNYNDIPGDGNVGSYRYLPLRADSFFGNSLDVNTGINLYLRTFSNGEVRVTNVGSTTSYRAMRASNYFGDSLDANAGPSVYIRPYSNGEVRITNTGSTTSYRPLRASNLFGDSIAVNSGAILYLQSAWGGEVRATALGSTTSYVPLRVSNIYANSIDNQGGSMYIRPSASGSAHVTVSGTTNNYRPIYASEHSTGSLAEYKQDIEFWNESALNIITQAEIYKYRLKSDIANGKYNIKYGMVIGEGYNTPQEFLSENSQGIDNYVLSSINLKAIQELSNITSQHTDDINFLKMENQVLKQRLNQLEGAA